MMFSGAISQRSPCSWAASLSDAAVYSASEALHRWLRASSQSERGALFDGLTLILHQRTTLNEVAGFPLQTMCLHGQGGSVAQQR